MATTRRCLLATVVLATALQLVGLSRADLPAQDGLKFLQAARRFQREPWADVIRATDRHPLYPALIALTEPVVSAVLGPGPEAWCLSARLISALAALALLGPLFGLTRALFDEATAVLAALCWVLLPLPGALGHDTLADPLALLGFLSSLWLGECALRTRSLKSAFGCGLAAGFGYLARPEVALAPLAVLITGAAQWAWTTMRSRTARDETCQRSARLPLAALSLSFLTVVGSYALVKGEVSEKLALRFATNLSTDHGVSRRAAQWVPKGLDDPRWDFAPKEESSHPGNVSFLPALSRLFARLAEAMGYVLFPLAVWGACRTRHRVGPGGAVLAVYAAVFALVLLRHQMTLGYLSARHTLTLALVLLPWSAAAAWAIAWRLSDRMQGNTARLRIAQAAALIALVSVGVVAQLKPAHPSRWGQGEAGRWLMSHAKPNESVLDTRGWAAFVSGCRSYDPWHIRQALGDASLAYIVVGADELAAGSRRAETLQALLAYSAEPAAGFPERRGGTDESILIYRYRRPESWEGLRP